MAGSADRNKNVAMAARLKADKIVRKLARCPICHKVKGLKGFYSHIVTCGG